VDAWSSFLPFLGLAIVVVVTPGPDMLLVMRNTLVGGRAVGSATVAGVMAGILCWSLLAVVGVAAILAASAAAFTVLKLCGAAYLVYLGVTSIRATGSEMHVRGGRAAGSLRQAAAQGFLSAALNPKLGVFFLTLLPQFGDAAGSVGRLVVLALVFAATGLVWLLVFTAMVASVGDVLSRPGLRRALGRVTGAVFIGLGLRVAVER
jgi:threonine/homoserine/homoserine lactone efflux protein